MEASTGGVKTFFEVKESGIKGSDTYKLHVLPLCTLYPFLCSSISLDLWFSDLATLSNHKRNLKYMPSFYPRHCEFIGFAWGLGTSTFKTLCAARFESYLSRIL